MRALLLTSLLLQAFAACAQETAQRLLYTKPDLPLDMLIFLIVMAGIFGLVFYLMYRSATPTYTELQWEVTENQRWEDHFRVTPRFDRIEQRCGWKVPEVIRKLYANKGLVVARDFYLIDPQESVAAWHIANFLPARVMTVNDVWPNYPDAFFFAATQFGDLYFVPTDAECESPLPVLLLQRDGEVTKVADSARDFFGWHRVSAELYHRTENQSPRNN